MRTCRRDDIACLHRPLGTNVSQRDRRRLPATAAACPRPLIQFFVLPPGGVWTLAQAYSTAATASWKTDRQNRRLVPILGLDHGRQ